MLEGVLQAGGTASEAAVAGYTLAGKTGTAEKAENGGYSKTKFVASFIGFAPARNPRLLGGGDGGRAARLDLRRRGGRARVREDRVLRAAVPEDPARVGGVSRSQGPGWSQSTPSGPPAPPSTAASACRSS